MQMSCRHNFVEGSRGIYCTRCSIAKRHYAYRRHKQYRRQTNRHKTKRNRLDYCIKPQNYARIPPRTAISDDMQGLMKSPGHRDNILDPHHSYLNIGLAWDRHNMMIVQHFEYDYATFNKMPSTSHGVLFFSISAKNGTGLDDMSVQILYDPPPQELTGGQLARTYCYDAGIVVASEAAPAARLVL